MRRIELVCAVIVFLSWNCVIFGLACSKPNYDKYDKRDQRELQHDLTTGSGVIYLRDFVSGVCFHSWAWKPAGRYSYTPNWVVPCESVNGRLEQVTMAGIYLFDPASGACVVGYGPRDEVRRFFPVPCYAAVIDQLDPHVQLLAKETFKWPIRPSQ
mgnify:CR=1 FL=1